MKAWMNKLGGVLLASLLTVMLNGKAYANDEGTSEPPATEINESTGASAAPAAADPVPVVTEALAPMPVEAPAPAPDAIVAEPVTPVAQEALIVAEAAPAPAAEPVAEPVVEAIPEAPAPVAEPVVEAIPEAPAPAAEPVIEAVPEAPAPVTEPVIEAVPEAPAPVAEPVVEAVPDAPAPAAEPVVEAIPEAPAPAAEPVVEAVLEAPTHVTEPADETEQEVSVAVEVEMPEEEPAAETPAIANPTTESIVELSEVITPGEAPSETPIETTDETTVETLVETPAELLEFAAEVATVESETTVLPEDSAAADRNVQLRTFAAIPVKQEAENNASVGASTVETTLSLRKLSASPALLGTSAPDADGGSKSGGTDPEEKDPEDKQPDEKAPDENDADKSASDGKKSATRSASASASVFSQNEDGSYVLVNHKGTETLSADGDVTINAAGLNRLGTISVNGNINLVGTGILLVDEIEMAEGKEFFLQPNKEIYGESGGSVAVFLKQENGDYLLINGSVDGILDEEYEIPAGVTLVVPDGSRLVMQSVAVGKYTSLGGEESFLYSTHGESEIIKGLPGYETDGRYYEHYDGTIKFSDTEGKDLSTSPKLTILEKAKLVIQEKAALIMNSVSKHLGGSLAPLIEVSGTLEQNGSVSGGLVTVDKSGDLTGNGIFTGTEITVDGNRSKALTSVNVANNKILLNGSNADLGTLTVSGNSSLVYKEPSSVNKVEVAPNTTLSVYSKDGYGSNKELTILKGVSGGGSVEVHSGVFVLGENCKVSDSTLVAAQATWTGPQGSTVSTTLAAIYDYYLDEAGHANLTPNETPRVETRDVAQDHNENDPVTIPCFVTRFGNYAINMDYDISVGLEKATRETTLDFSYLKSQENTATVSYQTLIAPWSNYLTNHSDDKYLKTEPPILLETEENGKWSTIMLLSDDPNAEVLAKNVKRIRILVQLPSAAPTQGGGTVTSTNTAYTGSGILGGSGAGSLSGGNSTMILRGNGLHKDDPEPDPNPNPNPNPNPDPSPKPDPDPDPKPDPDPDPKSDPDPDPTPDPDPAPDPDPEPDPAPDLDPDPAPDPNPEQDQDQDLDPDPDPDPDPFVTYIEDAEGEAPLVWVELATAVNTNADTPAEKQYVLLALEGEKTLEDLGGKATVTMEYTPPAEYAGKTLYVVFRNKDGTLTAIRATWSEHTGLLSFITDRLGTFMVVGLDFDIEEIEELPKDFYDALVKLPELENLVFAEYNPV